MRGHGSAWGDTIPSFGVANRLAKMYNIKFTTALNGRRWMILNATTNQKLVALTKGSMEGRCNEREVQGKRNSIVLGVLDVK